MDRVLVGECADRDCPGCGDVDRNDGLIVGGRGEIGV